MVNLHSILTKISEIERDLERWVKETFADRYFSRWDSFYFHTPLFPRVEKWMAVRKKENERKRDAPRFTARLPLLQLPSRFRNRIPPGVSTSMSTSDIDYWMSE